MYYPTLSTPASERSVARTDRSRARCLQIATGCGTTCSNATLRTVFTIIFRMPPAPPIPNWSKSRSSPRVRFLGAKPTARRCSPPELSYEIKNENSRFLNQFGGNTARLSSALAARAQPKGVCQRHLCHTGHSRSDRSNARGLPDLGEYAEQSGLALSMLECGSAGGRSRIGGSPHATP